MTGKLAVTGIHHGVTIIKNKARAMKFYQDLLGFKEIPSEQPNAPHVSWLLLDSGIMIHLIESPDAPAKPHSVHHAFLVKDFEGTKEILRQNGYPIIREGVRYDGQAFFYTDDPDGNNVEFCTDAGYAPAPPRP